MRHRRHAGCRVAAERAADRYTLICDGPQILELQHASAFLQAPIAATIDHEPALKDQSTAYSCCLWVCPCVAGPAWDDDGQIRLDQRLWAAIPPAGATTTGKGHLPARLGAPMEIPAHKELCTGDSVASGRPDLPGGGAG